MIPLTTQKDDWKTQVVGLSSGVLYVGMGEKFNPLSVDSANQTSHDRSPTHIEETT